MLLFVLLFHLLPSLALSEHRPPNIIITLGTGIGWGDIQANDRYTSFTPNIDAFIERGLNYRDFYVSGTNPSASMASLLTGRASPWTGVKKSFKSNSVGGLPLTERTLADYLHEVGYATGFFGVWDLGHTEGYLPGDRGFDYFYGTPYGQLDGGCVVTGEAGEETCEGRGLPLYENSAIIEQPVSYANMSNAVILAKVKRFIESALDADEPFFIILSPFTVNQPREKSSRLKILANLDEMVGRTEELLVKEGLSDTTLRIFTSKIGPIASLCELSGDVGPYLGIWQTNHFSDTSSTAGTSWEGGVRVPFGVVYPGLVQPNGFNTFIRSTMDILPTISELANLTLPTDRLFDGISLTIDWEMQSIPSLWNDHREILFFEETDVNDEINVIRSHYKKVYWRTTGAHSCNSTSVKGIVPVQHNPPLVFDLLKDKSEFQSTIPDQFGYRYYDEARRRLQKYFFNSTGVLRSVVDYTEDEAVVPCCGKECVCTRQMDSADLTNILLEGIQLPESLVRNVVLVANPTPVKLATVKDQLADEVASDTDRAVLPIYGMVFIGLAVVSVVGLAGYQGYRAAIQYRYSHPRISEEEASQLLHSS